jgi:hypothetical protein
MNMGVNRQGDAKETPEDTSAPRAAVCAWLRDEWSLATSLVTIAVFTFWGTSWLADLTNHLWFALMLAWLFQNQRVAGCGPSPPVSCLFHAHFRKIAPCT